MNQWVTHMKGLGAADGHYMLWSVFREKPKVGRGGVETDGSAFEVWVHEFN